MYRRRAGNPRGSGSPGAVSRRRRANPRVRSPGRRVRAARVGSGAGAASRGRITGRVRRAFRSGITSAGRENPVRPNIFRVRTSRRYRPTRDSRPSRRSRAARPRTAPDRRGRGRTGRPDPSRRIPYRDRRGGPNRAVGSRVAISTNTARTAIARTIRIRVRGVRDRYPTRAHNGPACPRCPMFRRCRIFRRSRVSRDRPARRNHPDRQVACHPDRRKVACHPELRKALSRRELRDHPGTPAARAPRSRAGPDIPARTHSARSLVRRSPADPV